jgi:hypothetical protein
MQTKKIVTSSGTTFFSGGGEMGERIRSYPWENSPIGSPDKWPPSLLASVNLLLNSKFPMFIWWGEEYITLYNDAYIVILGDKHPDALGRPGSIVWKEVWDEVAPLTELVFQKGGSTWAEDQLFVVNRQGYLEESYFTFSHSPIYDEQGKVGGVFCVCTETTEKVMTARNVQKSEQNFRELVMKAPVGICIVNSESVKVEVVNDAFLELVGRERDSFENRPYWETLQEAEPYYGPVLTEVFKTGITYVGKEAEVTLVRNGKEELVYISFVYEPIKISDNTVDRVMILGIEVSEQVKARKKIEESAQEVRSLVESAPFPIGVYIGKEMRIKLANQAIIDVFGKGPDIIGKLYSEVLPELAGSGIYEQLDGVFTTGIPYHAKNQRVDIVVDGKLQPFYFNYSFTPLFGEGGNVYGVMNTAAEVTDLNLALQKVIEAEEKARLAIESAEMGTYEMDLITGEIKGSYRFESIWGIPTTNDPNAYIALIHPDDRIIRVRAHEESQKTGNLNYEVRIFHPKEELRWTRVRGRILFSEDGVAQRLTGVVQDITEQKLFAAELEKQVRERTLALEEAQQTLLLSNQYLQNIINRFETAFASLLPVFEGEEIVDFRFKASNEAYSNYSKLPPEAIQDKIVSEIFPNYQKTDAFENYVGTYKTGKPHKWDLHYNLDGLDVYLTVVCSKINDEVAVHFTDFTTLKRLQSDLLRNIEELQRSNKNLEDFAYAASHDLKEPIRKIHFFSDRLKNEIKEKLSQEQLAIFSKLENATKRMRSLVEDLLSYSQVNQKPREFETVNLDQVMKGVQADLELEIEEKGATITMGNLPSVQGFSRQLQQLFQNLLSNALKYRKPERPLRVNVHYKVVKGVEVPLSLSTEEKQKTYYQITVSDNGIGFSQQEAEIIFHVFQRLHTNDEYRGTGVGLSIARKVAENHQGFIWATGNPGEGASFEVLLPVPQK